MRSKITIRILTIVSIVLFSISVLAYIYKFHHALSDDHSAWGEFGDYFGGTISAVFSFASFIVVLLTLRLQSETLADARKGSEKQDENFRKEISLYKSSQELSRFETNFFALLQNHLGMIQSLSISVPFRDGEGRDRVNNQRGRPVFLIAVEQFDFKVSRQITKQKSVNIAINSLWIDFYKQYQPVIGHYFRSLYHIFYYIALEYPGLDAFKIDPGSIHKYAKIARSQMQIEEVILLYYNAKSGRGVNFKPYVEFFSLLEDLPESLPTATIYIRQPDDYNESAFSDKSPKPDILQKIS